MDELAHRLRLRRIEMNLSKSELARRAGISHSVITRIESGEYKHSKHLFGISDVLQVDVNWLVRGKNFNGKNPEVKDSGEVRARATNKQPNGSSSDAQAAPAIRINDYIT